MNEKLKTLLYYLNSADEALTMHELFQMMTLDDREFFRDMNDISYKLNSLRDKKLWIKNGPEKTVNKKTFLSWMITEKGKRALQDNNADPIIDDSIQTIELTEPVEDNTSTNPIDSPIHLHLIEEPDQMEIDDPMAFYDSAHLAVRAMLETLLKQKPAQTIQHKTGKIEVLEYFKNFAQPLNADFAAVLGDIINDLSAMEEA